MQKIKQDFLASGVGDLPLKGSLYGRRVIVVLGRRSKMVSLWREEWIWGGAVEAIGRGWVQLAFIGRGYYHWNKPRVYWSWITSIKACTSLHARHLHLFYILQYGIKQKCTLPKFCTKVMDCKASSGKYYWSKTNFSQETKRVSTYWCDNK